MGRLLGIAVLSLALAAAEAQQVLKKMCEIGVGFSFAALSVFRLRRAEAASAVWIPHWHSEPFESQGARAAKRYVNGNLVEREKHHLNLHLNLGVGCAPSCWPIFGFRNLLGAPRGAQQVLKKIVRLASVFPSPPFRSSDFAGLRRPRLYGFHTGTRSLSNRKGRGRRSGGREREPRRAGEGRLSLESKLLRPDRLSPVGSKK